MLEISRQGQLDGGATIEHSCASCREGHHFLHDEPYLVANPPSAVVPKGNVLDRRIEQSRMRLLVRQTFG